jgi:uncharacterized protein (TIRG00374 family)
LSESAAALPAPKRWLRPRHVLIAVVALAACVIVLRRLDFARVLATLRSADPRLVAGALLISLGLNTTARVLRRRALLRALPHSGPGAGFVELASLLFVGATANKFLPARAGDAITTVQLNRRHGYPLAALVAAQLLEKVLEATGLCLMALVCAVCFPPTSIPTAPFFVLGALGVAALGFLVVGSRAARRRGEGPVATTASPPEMAGAVLPKRGLRARVGTFLERLGGSVRLLGAPHIWPPALLWSLFSDLCDVAMIAICLRAVGLHGYPGLWLFIYLAVNLAIAVPLTPGQLGVLEAGAVLALSTAGVPRSEALAFALIYHAVQVIPAALLALPGWSRLEWSSAARERP